MVERGKGGKIPCPIKHDCRYQGKDGRCTAPRCPEVPRRVSFVPMVGLVAWGVAYSAG